MRGENARAGVGEEKRACACVLTPIAPPPLAPIIPSPFLFTQAASWARPPPPLAWWAPSLRAWTAPWRGCGVSRGRGGEKQHPKRPPPAPFFNLTPLLPSYSSSPSLTPLVSLSLPPRPPTRPLPSQASTTPGTQPQAGRRPARPWASAWDAPAPPWRRPSRSRASPRRSRRAGGTWSRTRPRCGPACTRACPPCVRSEGGRARAPMRERACVVVCSFFP